MRMLDADALAEAMGVTRLMIPEWKAESAWGVPIVDAEPVVRCRDCKWWRLSMYNTCGIHICQRFSGVRGEHDFCSRGERKDGADE